MRGVSLCSVIVPVLLSASAAADPVTYLISGKFPVEGCASDLDHGTWVEVSTRSFCGKSFQGYLTIDDDPIYVYQDMATYFGSGYPYGLIIKVDKTRAYGFSDVRVDVRNDADGYGPHGHDYINLSADLPNNGDSFFFSLFDFAKTAIAEVGGKLPELDVTRYQYYCLDNSEGCMLKIGSAMGTTQDMSAGYAHTLEDLSLQKLPYVIPARPGLLQPMG